MKALAEIRPDAVKTIDLQTNLFEANVLDSFGVIEFISALEAEFDINISNDDLVPQNIWSVEATATMIQRYLDARA